MTMLLTSKMLRSLRIRIVNKVNKAMVNFNRGMVPSRQPAIFSLHDAYSVFEKLMEKHPRPSTYDVTAVLSETAKLKQYGTVLGFFKMMHLKRIPPNQFTIGIVANCYANLKLVSLFSHLLAFALKSGVDLNLQIFNAYIKGLVEEDQTKLAIQMMFNMQELYSIQPDFYTYGSIITGMSREGNYTRAVAMLWEMEKEFPPNIMVYNSLIHSLCLLGEVLDASVVLSRMYRVGLSPDTRTHTSFLTAFNRLGHTNEALQLLDKMATMNIRPDVWSFTAVADSLCKDDRMEEAIKLIATMSVRCIEPDYVLFSTLMASYLRKGQLAMARQLLLSSKYVSTGSYNTLIDAYCKRWKVLEAWNLVKQMLEKKIIPDEITYTILIDVHIRLHDTKLSMSLFHGMLRHGVSPNVYTYSAMIGGLLRDGQFNEVKELVQLLERQNISPDIVLYGIIVDYFCSVGDVRTASLYFSHALSCGVSPDTRMHNSLIKAYSKKGLMLDAEHCLRQMEVAGCASNVYSYKPIILAYLKNNEEEKAKEFCGQMMARNITDEEFWPVYHEKGDGRIKDDIVNHDQKVDPMILMLLT